MTVKSTPQFDSDTKYYLKKKRYTKINKDIELVLEEFKKGRLVGDKLSGFKIPENSAVYKVRVANSSVGFGKSNGFRILYYAKIGDEIYLLSIYSKKDDDRILGKNQIQNLIDKIISDK